MIQPVAVEHFYHDGRGPELHRVHWRQPTCAVLLGIDYILPDGTDLLHVGFVRPQVFMFTPEEVIPYGTSSVVDFGAFRPAAAFDRGRSEWLLTFNPQHLDRCRHFQLLFYDELLDVICEDLAFRDGSYLES